MAEEHLKGSDSKKEDKPDHRMFSGLFLVSVSFDLTEQARSYSSSQHALPASPLAKVRKVREHLGR